MKKNKIQDIFLEHLKKVPVVQLACEKSGISRNSVYRWKKEDSDFSKKMDQALLEGEAVINDLTESQLLSLIQEKNFSAIRFWLQNRNTRFKNKLEITTQEKIEELSPAQAKVVKEALDLAGINKNNSLNNIQKYD